MTVTVALAEPEPPVPVQVTLYAVVAPGVTTTEPDVAFPVAKPVPVQEVAFVEDHVSVEDPPDVTEVGEAVRDAVAAGTTVTVAEEFAVPPAPVQEML